jgi:hypothetical protein
VEADFLHEITPKRLCIKRKLLLKLVKPVAFRLLRAPCTRSV